MLISKMIQLLLATVIIMQHLLHVLFSLSKQKLYAVVVILHCWCIPLSRKKRNISFVSNETKRAYLKDSLEIL